MKISLVIPMYNETAILPEILPRLSDWAETHLEAGSYEILFVDDGSTDHSADLIRDFASEHPAFRSIGYPKNRGKGCAVRTGMLEAKGDIVIYTDCELALGLDPITAAAERFLSAPETDLVIGSRNLSNDGYKDYSRLRYIASKTYIKLLGILTGFRLSDSQCGFKAFRRESAQAIFSLCQTDGFAFDIEVIMIAQKQNRKIEEIPVRVTGHRPSKVHIVKDSLKMLSDVRRIKRYVKTL